MHTPEGFEPRSSANWLIDEITKEAKLQGSPLSDWDLRVLRSPITDFQDNERHLVEATHNLAVNLARSAIERAKDQGLETLEVREGLVIPQIWEDHYETVYESELPWMVSLVMQNAFLGNPFVDETEPWNSPQSGQQSGLVSTQKATTVSPPPRSNPVSSPPRSSPGGGPPPTNKLQNWALGLGIASVFLFETLVIPMAAIIVGGLSLSKASELKNRGVEKTGFGLSLTGLILGIVYAFSGFVQVLGIV